MFKKEIILHMVAYLKVRIAEEERKKLDSIYLNSVEVLECPRRACARLDAFKNVLKELEWYYGQKL